MAVGVEQELRRRPATLLLNPEALAAVVRDHPPLVAELPNLRALNFLLHGALGGGGTLSLKTDAQGKVYSTALLRMEIRVPADLDV